MDAPLSLESLADLESYFASIGRAQGIPVGHALGLLEGGRLGQTYGFALGREAGFYAGVAEALEQMEGEHPGTVGIRSLKTLSTITSLSTNFPLTNPVSAHAAANDDDISVGHSHAHDAAADDDSERTDMADPSDAIRALRARYRLLLAQLHAHLAKTRADSEKGASAPAVTNMDVLRFDYKPPGSGQASSLGF
ncbi:hypothetical protein M427DRAFT_131971 [Gonapodya prolifera JEL478]|uniref:Essential protein Yae1 N-terminal domain-containing protein n=1 Tax=Gonapodya prolifera (strain JEL478) TaxID=1344416 RepID=A0A139ARR6_GONPJ|nr:hypothetical protein M427DRAFT_131971 [Gonapodya prolifera JEL478]|eukprot:KXS19441.1 hypothetical protein M427DRAFT_131971 [Gonapodya prolifera JEL478]